MGLLQTGRTGQVYLKKQSAQGTTPTLASTDAMRHRQVLFTSDPFSKVNTDEKSASPGRSVANRVAMREVASWTLESLIRPSGTLNTVPEADELLECAFGARSNVTLSTTVSTGTGAVGGCTLASGTGLALHDHLLIVCPDGKKRVRRITAVNTGTGVTTWAPALPTGQEPADGAAVKACLTYKPTSALILALTIGHYLQKSDGSAGLARQVVDAAVESFGFTFDAKQLPLLKAGGFAKKMETAQSKPGAFTTAGTVVPTGLSGEIVVGSVFDLKFLKMAIDVTNGMFSRNESYGYGSQEEFFRSGYRDIAVGLDVRAGAVSDQPYAAALGGTNLSVFKQTGFTEGSIIALSMPQVEFKVPDTDDPDDAVSWPLKGMALESTDGANDDLFIAFA